MLQRFRHVFVLVLLLLVASCSGQGCSGCSGCAGTTPLPEGFPKAMAIENAASVRVSRPGLDFVEKNLGPVAAKLAGAQDGKLALSIPETPFNQPGVIDLVVTSVDVVGKFCPGGPDPKANPPRCTAEVNIGGATFQLDAVTPNAIDLRATIPLKLDDTPVDADFNPGPALTLHVGYGANGTCVGNAQERASVSPKALPIRVRLPLVAETTAPRDGYTKVDIDNAEINLDAISADDIRICADCGVLTILGFNVCNSVLNLGFIKGFIVDSLKSGLQSQVKSVLADALCTTPNPAATPSCPKDSAPDAQNKKCVYDSNKNKCVPTLLGTDAHINLGGFLAGISPGATGGLDFGLAAGGPMQPRPGLGPVGDRTPNGMTLGMMGGVVPQPPSKCVTQAALTLPTGIPIPDELSPSKADPAGTPHVGIALSGRFLDYSLGSVYNSGLLCLGVSTEQFDMLKTGLLSIIIPSIKSLTFERGDAAAAIATRPQSPPTVKVGGGTNIDTDPLLLVTAPKFAIDFYVWSYDRFIRAFTFEGDLTIPVSLQTGKDPQTNPAGGIVPVIGAINVANAKVENAGLLTDEPTVIAAALSGLIGTLGKQLVGGAFAPIDLSAAVSTLGLNLEVNDVKKLSKDGDDFVGLFGTLSKPAPAVGQAAQTQATLLKKTVHPEAMQLATYRRDALPELVVALASSLEDGQRSVEYSWWIDRGTRSAWAPSKALTLNDDQLFLQGKHVLHIASRVVGHPETETDPFALPYVIDALAPFVKLKVDAGNVSVDTWDLVSEPKDLVGRYRLDDGAFSEWGPVSALANVAAGPARTIDVEVKDEEGNVGRISQAIIRGRTDGTLAAAGSGCACSTPGQPTSADQRGAIALVIGAALLGLVVLRRRQGSLRTGAFRASRAAVALGAITALAATTQGCGCGSDEDNRAGCGSDCKQECKPALATGQPGSYTSLAKAGDGSIWVAGYNDALIADGDTTPWGDLVVGRYDSGKQQVQWETVDGVPARTDGTCPSHDRAGFRNGETEAGDNVGLWTAIQVPSDGRPVVAYQDATNHRLKFAYQEDGWKSFVLREAPGADVGRYAKMVLVDDKPVVAFLQFDPGPDGRIRSKVVVARANVPHPHGPEAFTFEDAAVEEANPCRSNSCPGGQACIKSTGACTPVATGCAAACSATTACVALGEAAPACAAVKGPIETVPDVFGTYVALASGGGKLGIAVYDRPHGNLVALVNKGGTTWERVIVDGENGSRADNSAKDTGDMGLGASLAIDDAGTWHMSYVSGLDETLRYVTLTGNAPGTSVVVDDGTAVNDKPFTDGRHFVGDDSWIRVEGSAVTIVYQDATTGSLRRAMSAQPGGEAGRAFALRALDQPNKFGGFFPRTLPGDDRVANFWRQTIKDTKTVLGDVAFVTP